MPVLLSAVAGVLVMHQSLGNAALDSLAAIGVMDPRMGVPLLLAVLFYSNIFTMNDTISHNMLVSSPFICWFVSLLLNDGCVSFAFWLCYLSLYLDIPLSQPFLQLKVLGVLPSLASHSMMIPLIVQTILPMLHKDAKPYVLWTKYPWSLSFHSLVIILVALPYHGMFCGNYCYVMEGVDATPCIRCW